MNTDTGQIYEGQESILAAKARGENVVPVSRKVARTVQIGAKEVERRMVTLRRNRPDLPENELRELAMKLL